MFVLFLVTENSELPVEESTASEGIRRALSDHAVASKEIVLRLSAGRIRKKKINYNIPSVGVPCGAIDKLKLIFQSRVSRCKR